MPEEHDEFVDESIYGDESREDMVAGDSISPEEEAFMRGYEESDKDPDDLEMNEEEDDD